MNSLNFGTSGLRGLVEDLLGWPSYGYAKAFVARMEARSAPGMERRLLLGRDLRPSSPAIAAACAAAARDSGWAVTDCGGVPTPALALEAIARGLPAIMITGSHIPDDRNGLKFYTAEGEITKADEAAIGAGFATLDEATDGSSEIPETPEAEIDRGPLDRYVERFVDAFGAEALAGLTVGVYQHSTVSRDLIADVLAALGATPLPFARSDSFIPVDTEAHRPEDIEILKAFAREHRVDAIVSADGDADRPLVADADGRILRGDTLGLLTALALGIAEIVTPVTSSSAIERACAPARVRRTRVGSPFVLAEMDAAIRDGAEGVIGFEANGGVLLGTDAMTGAGNLPALPTRDAVLPIVAVLREIVRRQHPLSGIVEALDIGSAAADRLKNIPGDISRELLRRLAGEPAFAEGFLSDLGPIEAMSDIDGVRFTLAGNEIVHYRASGNAPELRCYVEAASPERASSLLSAGLAKAADFVAQA